jgi:hypothetical protein
MSMPMLAGVGLLVVCCSSSAAAMMRGGGGEEKEDPVVPKTPAEIAAAAAAAAAPTPDIMLEDKMPYAYEAGKLYGCTSGKDVGCLFRAEANGIAAAAGMYDPVGKKCSKGDHVYCVNDKTVTMAEYSDNTPAGTGAWNETMHRYAATGKACPTASAANCQDDQSIASYQGWGGGNTAKITTKVTERQCVDSAFLYC